MKKINNLLLDNTNVFEQNMHTLFNLRPNHKFIFRNTGKGTSYSLEASSKFSLDEFEKIINETMALNTSIILACYSYFESCFENLLLDNLNTTSLNDEQERIMNRYIDIVIKLSSIEKYEKEFALITGNNFNTFFINQEIQSYKVIKELYTLRHILVHGSASKRVYETDGKILLDEEDTEYQQLIDFIIKQTNVNIPKKNYTLNLILLNNEIFDILMTSTTIITNKFKMHTKNLLKFIKENPNKK